MNYLQKNRVSLATDLISDSEPRTTKEWPARPAHSGLSPTVSTPSLPRCAPHGYIWPIGLSTVLQSHPTIAPTPSLPSSLLSQSSLSLSKSFMPSLNATSSQQLLQSVSLS